MFHFTKYLLLAVLFIFGCKADNKILESEIMDYSAIKCCNSDSTVNVLVEIPAGTTAKYELNKNTQRIEIDSIDGKPRYINYLAYPANYGMVLSTMHSKSKGGDGDPLDVMLLGNQFERGSVVKSRIIGGLHLMDSGEFDDKLIAVPLDDKWSKVESLEDLKSYFPGAYDIVSIFFQNYKGADKMEFLGDLSTDESLALLSSAKTSQ